MGRRSPHFLWRAGPGWRLVAFRDISGRARSVRSGKRLRHCGLYARRRPGSATFRARLQLHGLDVLVDRPTAAGHLYTGSWAGGTSVYPIGLAQRLAGGCLHPGIVRTGTLGNDARTDRAGSGTPGDVGGFCGDPCGLLPEGAHYPTQVRIDNYSKCGCCRHNGLLDTGWASFCNQGRRPTLRSTRDSGKAGGVAETLEAARMEGCRRWWSATRNRRGDYFDQWQPHKGCCRP